MEFNFSKEEDQFVAPDFVLCFYFTTSKVHWGRNVSYKMRDVLTLKLLIDHLIDALMININT